MEKYLFITFLLFNINISAQIIGGTPATGVTKIPRVSGYKATEQPINSEQRAPNDVITPTRTSTEVGITDGALSVSLSGAANYTIPIMVPKGINGVEPNISLSYNSQGGNGIASYGWDLSGISAITRIPSTKFHDNTIDSLDYNNLDRFPLDGQRLILTNPTGTNYLYNGAIFETENFSKVRITYITSTVNYFFVEYPDGSTAKYGTTTESQDNSFGITELKSAQENIITYTYVKENNVSRITTINYSYYSGSPFCTINFLYVARLRTEQSYINGTSFLSNKILSEINTNTNTNVLLRKYNLIYDIGTTTIGYQRLDRITESTFTGGVSKSYNPTVFSYGSTSETINYGNVLASLTVGSIEIRNAETVSGDFDGDGKLDFILYPTIGPVAKAKYWTFIDNTNSSSLLFDYVHNVGSFQKIFATSWLYSPAANVFKLSPREGWCVVTRAAGTNITSFSNYSWNASGIYNQHNRTYNFPTVGLTQIPKEYLNGDFNGDGLTDVVIVNINNGSSTTSGQAGISYFLDLDRRITANFTNSAGTITVSNGSKILCCRCKW